MYCTSKSHATKQAVLFFEIGEQDSTLKTRFMQKTIQLFWEIEMHDPVGKSSEVQSLKNKMMISRNRNEHANSADRICCVE